MKVKYIVKNLICKSLYRLALIQTYKDYDEIFLKCLSPKKENRYSTEELISILSNMQYTRLTTKNSAYAVVNSFR